MSVVFVARGGQRHPGPRSPKGKVTRRSATQGTRRSHRARLNSSTAANRSGSLARPRPHPSVPKLTWPTTDHTVITAIIEVVLAVPLVMTAILAAFRREPNQPPRKSAPQAGAPSVSALRHADQVRPSIVRRCRAGTATKFAEVDEAITSSQTTQRRATMTTRYSDRSSRRVVPHATSPAAIELYRPGSDPRRPAASCAGALRWRSLLKLPRRRPRRHGADSGVERTKHQYEPFNMEPEQCHRRIDPLRMPTHRQGDRRTRDSSRWVAKKQARVQPVS